MVEEVKLRKRGNIYWFRKRVPKALVTKIGKSFVQCSLETPELDEAKRRAAHHLAAFEEMCAEARQSNSPAVYRSPPSLSDEQMLGVVQAHVQSADQRNIRTFELLDREGQSEALEEANERSGFYADPDLDECRSATQNLERNLFPQLMTEPFGSSIRCLARRYVREGLLEIEARQVARLSSYRHPHIYNQLFDPSLAVSKTAEDARPALTANACFDLWLDEYWKTTRATTSKRKDKMGASIKFFKRFFGDVPVQTIDRAKIRDFRDLLAVYPSNARKKLGQIAEDPAVAVKLAKERELPVLSYASQQEYLRQLNRALNWARAEGFIVTNPAENMPPLRQHDLDEAEDLKDPFTQGELKRIFSTGIFSMEAALTEDEFARFWVPLIALHSGMRANEVCQLEIDDVHVEVLGHSYFSVVRTSAGDNALSAKRRKTVSSQRNIPVHKVLIELGFLEYLIWAKQQGSLQLFPMLKISPDGYFSRSVTDWFNNRHLPAAKAKGNRTSFHSLRHTVRDQLREQSTPLEITWAIGGWKAQGEDARYGKGARALNIEVLSRHVNALHFDIDVAACASVFSRALS